MPFSPETPFARAVSSRAAGRAAVSQPLSEDRLAVLLFERV